MQIVQTREFYIAAGRLGGKEKIAILDFINEFMEDHTRPGISLEKLTKTKSPGIWSARTNQELRVILHKKGDTWTFLNVDHHEAAYRWAENRRIELHPITEVLQIVECGHEVEDHLKEREKSSKSLNTTVGKKLFEKYDDAYLLSLGFPEHWLGALRQFMADDEDEILAAAEKLPPEVGERLLRLAAGETVLPPVCTPGATGALHPDFKRSLFVVQDPAMLEILKKPFEVWMRFLHPDQEKIAFGDFAGPVKVTGSAGTGKTVVGMHRARHLAKTGKRVLMATFCNTLCDNIRKNLNVLCDDDELSRITVATVDSQAIRIVKSWTGTWPLPLPPTISTRGGWKAPSTQWWWTRCRTLPPRRQDF